MALGPMVLGNGVKTDTALNTSGVPADAKATGDALAGKLGLHATADNAQKWGGNAYTDAVLNAIAGRNGIAASGDNYIRFTDGTQICWGILYDLPSNIFITFQVAFIRDPVMSIARVDSSATLGMIWISGISATRFSATSASNITGHWIAIGYWK